VFILALLGIYIGGAFALFAWRAPSMRPVGAFAPVSREGSLVLNNLLLCSIAAVVLVGTLYPMFADLLVGAKISVGPPFFEDGDLPARRAAHRGDGGRRGDAVEACRARAGLRAAVVGGGGGARAFLLCLALTGVRIGPALGFGAAAWLIIGAFADVADRIALFKRPGAAWSRFAGLPRSTLGGAVAHAGMGVTILGLAGWDWPRTSSRNCGPARRRPSRATSGGWSASRTRRGRTSRRVARRSP
jgi:cytochrome c-type biogenesis protein CcmF